MSSFNLQFECAHGRIVLLIGNHDCTKDFSTNFVGITASFDFVAKWSEVVRKEKSPETALRQSDASRSTTVSTTTTGASIASRGVLDFEQPSPSKKRKFMTDPIDGAIERAKKGKPCL